MILTVILLIDAQAYFISLVSHCLSLILHGFGLTP